MLVSLSIIMISVLVLCPVLLAAAVQTLTIDSQLGTSIEDCFERIIIGEQLPSDAIYRNVSELTTRECEQICKQDKQCQSFDYGVGAKGNATCNLGNLDEKQLKGNLLRHPDYDVYVRRIGCEQSPPSPILADDPGDREPGDREPGDRPGHRPVFRPVDDKPDYLITTDLGAYADERPDDYTNPKPDFDAPPSYGAHKPQDIPYKPEKPDPYDQLQIQDPYKPQRPAYVPEKPDYHYIVRPNRKPRPQDTGYGRPDPVRPDPYGPPNRPRPGYNGQYASNYGQGQYQDNSIYLEINDPIRPHKPSRPIYTQGIYGYGSYSSQNSYTQDTQSHYSTGGQTGYGNQKPKPQKPGYGSDADDGYGGYGLKPQKPGYGSSSSDYDGYGSKPQKPGYGNPTISDGYGTKPQNSGYGGATSDYDGYGSKPQKPGYGSSTSDYDGYGSKPQKPGYGSSTSDYDGYGSKPQKPGYGSSTSDYDGYGSKPQKPDYGSKPQKPGYGSSTSDYDGYVSIPQKPDYGSKPQKPGYGSSTSDYDGYGSKPQQSGYGSSTSDYDGYGSKPQKPSYGSSTSDYDGYGSKPQKPGYGSSTSVSDGYGSKPQKPMYGSSTSDYDGYGSKPQKPGYGSSTSDYDGYGSKPQKPGYGSSTSDYDGYGSKPQKPGYGKPTISDGYGTKPQNPGYGSSNTDTSDGYGSKPQKPGYGNPSTDDYGYRPQKPSYGSSNTDQSDGYGTRPQSPGYGNTETFDGYGPKPQQPHGGSKPQNSGYGSSSTDDYGYGSRPQKPGYGNSEISDGYGSKPQKPSYGTSSYTGQSQHSSNQASYGTSHYYENRPQNNGYGTKPGNQGGYGNQGTYGSNSESDQGSYGSQGSNGYGSSGGYGSGQGSYGNQGSGNQGSSSQGSYGFSQASYGSTQSSHSSYYGSAYENKPGYSDNQGSHGGNQGSYGSNQGSYGSNQGSYGSNQASYGSNQASYGSNQGSYGGNQGSYGSTSDNKPSYGTDRPYQSKPIQQKPKPSYGNENEDDSNQGYGNRPYDKDRPDYVQPGYNNQEESGYEPVTPGYGEKPNKTGYLPDIRPVYEDEVGKPDAPSYIVRPNGDIVTSRPVAVGDYSDSGYGRHPGKDGSYKACFRRVLAGQRALRSHVRKVVPCERLEDCRRECATEKRFPCESFNYRLDPSFRGKGLCELMTKPIEAFDLRRDFVDDKDFDFYELDRNSLEPNCPDTLRGPGILHSGFLSSKPDRKQGWGDRSDWLDRDSNRYHGHGDRRHGDRFFVPYQINQGLARSNDDLENWGQYGGVYGGYDSYYKDRNDYHKSITHWRLDSEINRPFHGVKQDQNTDFDYSSLSKTGPWSSRYGGSWKRGRWNSAAVSNALDYESRDYRGESEVHESHGRSDEGRIKDCSSRRRPGMSLGTGAIRRALNARGVVECEAACFNERQFKCVSYSYRYSNSHGSDNCFLSERPYRGLEMAADSSSDVYAMPQDQGCVTINYKPWVESECFWHVRSGAAVSDGAVRGKLTVAGLGACEAECIRAHAFFCRGFSFRFDSPTIGDDLENCLLTSSPPTSLENGRGLRPNSGHELYSRGNYGRGCEPALYDDTQHKEEECYLQYDKAAKLTGAAIRGHARAKDEQACGRACTDAPFRCLSFSYNNNAPPDTDNCLLSEIRLFDLQRGVDYVHSADDWLFAFDLFNGQCWRKVHGNSDYDEPTQELPRPISGPPEDVHYPIGPPTGPSGPEYIPEHPDAPYISASPPSGPGYKPYPTGPDTPVFKPGYTDHPPGFKPGYTDHPPGFKPGYTDHPPGFKPGYSDHPPGFKPEYSDHPPEYKPYPSGPGFKPGYLEPSRPYPDEISGPGFKPGYPASDFKPGYPSGDFKPDYPTAPSGSDFKPQYPVGPPRPDHKPGYPDRPSYKPSYPAPDFKPYPPEVSGYPESHFKPEYPSGPSGPGYPARPSGPGPGYPAGSNRPVYPAGPSGPDYPVHNPPRPDIKPGYRPSKPDRPGYRPEKPGYPGSQRPVTGGRPGYPDREVNGGIAVSWRHYTVSGFPCRVGSACAQNQVAGHWACEPEGGEIGSWDYCCAPSHRCGYSEGFHKPWCYVGPTEDQWRPCSEKYYPYHQHKVPHPSSQGNKETQPARPRPWQDSPGYADRDRPNQRPYLSEGDRKYWDELYKNGPQSYYDKYGNPLPGYTRVPTADRPQIKYSHNYPRPGGGQWLPVSQQTQEEPNVPGLGVPRYWPVAYLHKGPPPNMTYFRYNETQSTTTEQPAQPPTTPQPTIDNVERNHRDEKKRIINENDDITEATTTIKAVTTEIPEPDIPEPRDEPEKPNEPEKPKIPIEPEPPATEKPVPHKTNLELTKVETFNDKIKGIDDKLDDFSGSIEIIDLDDIKGDKMADLKTLEAEERQIEEIGRILASRRGGKLVLDKRSQKDLESKNIAVDKDFIDFNFGNRFNVERRGVIKKVSKDEIDRLDKSLEVSETTFVRPPRVLSTTENIRKAIVNGKVFYDATIREQRDVFLNNSTRRSKSLRPVEEPNLTSNSFGKKIKTRNSNPVRRVRRVYRKRYDPEEVRRRLLERERTKESTTDNSKKI